MNYDTILNAHIVFNKPYLLDSQTCKNTYINGFQQNIIICTSPGDRYVANTWQPSFTIVDE